MALSVFDPLGFFSDDWAIAPVARGTDQMTIPMRVDFKEEADKFVVHADLPGCSKEDVHVDVHENTLTISAERKREETKDTEKYHRVERQYGKVTRSFRLPQTANMHNISAKYDNGVLTVSVEKTSPAVIAARRIDLS